MIQNRVLIDEELFLKFGILGDFINDVLNVFFLDVSSVALHTWEIDFITFDFEGFEFRSFVGFEEEFEGVDFDLIGDANLFLELFS